MSPVDIMQDVPAVLVSVAGELLEEDLGAATVKAALVNLPTKDLIGAMVM